MYIHVHDYWSIDNAVKFMTVGSVTLAMTEVSFRLHANVHDCDN